MKQRYNTKVIFHQEFIILILIFIISCDGTVRTTGYSTGIFCTGRTSALVGGQSTSSASVEG